MKRHPMSVVLTIACAAALLLSVTGCGRQKGLTLHFVFDDAKGLTVGDKVMGDGIAVGSVVAPPESPKPGHVVVTVRLDNISTNKLPYVTSDLSAIIRKDSMVAGVNYLDLVFPNKPGQTVAANAILKGQSKKGIDIPGLEIPEFDKKGAVDWSLKAFSVADANRTGSAAFYINWLCVGVLVLTVAAIVLDLLIRLPQGKPRDHSSPGILLLVWKMFCLCLLLKTLLFAIQLLPLVGVLEANVLDPWVIAPKTIGDLILRELAFWGFAAFLIGLRFRFDLLLKVRNRA